MSWKMKPHRSTPRRPASSSRHLNVQDAPRVERPLLLVCGVCRASGRYDVGTVTLDPEVFRSGEPNAAEKAVGFTGYFRCRKCDAGGPWELPKETIMYVTALAAASLSGIKDVPLVIGCTATFDKQVFRYATECEAHLKDLIDKQPDRAFLWVRLGNLYSHSGLNDRAQMAYERAIQLDPKDIEAHSMFGQLLAKMDQGLEAVPHWHAVLKHVREARQVHNELRRKLVRGAIQCLLEAHAESHGQIDLLPTHKPEETPRGREGEPLVLELRRFDLSSEEGIDDLCAFYLEPPRRMAPELFERPRRRVLHAADGFSAEPIHREALSVGRNDSCPCGSGRKYKKCCGR